MKNKKNIAVLGLGKSGIAAANLAVKLGFDVFASDKGVKRAVKALNKKVDTEFAGHTDRVLSSSLIVKSPGIHPDIDILKKAKAAKIPVISELRFALDNSKYKKLIAVTNTPIFFMFTYHIHYNNTKSEGKDNQNYNKN